MPYQVELNDELFNEALDEFVTGGATPDAAAEFQPEVQPEDPDALFNEALHEFAPVVAQPLQAPTPNAARVGSRGAPLLTPLQPAPSDEPHWALQTFRQLDAAARAALNTEPSAIQTPVGPLPQGVVDTGEAFARGLGEMGKMALGGVGGLVGGLGPAIVPGGKGYLEGAADISQSIQEGLTAAEHAVVPAPSPNVQTLLESLALPLEIPPAIGQYAESLGAPPIVSAGLEGLGYALPFAKAGPKIGKAAEVLPVVADSRWQRPPEKVVKAEFGSQGLPPIPADARSFTTKEQALSEGAAPAPRPVAAAPAPAPQPAAVPSPQPVPLAEVLQPPPVRPVPQEAPPLVSARPEAASNVVPIKKAPPLDDEGFFEAPEAPAATKPLSPVVPVERPAAPREVPPNLPDQPPVAPSADVVPIRPDLPPERIKQLTDEYEELKVRWRNLKGGSAGSFGGEHADVAVQMLQNRVEYGLRTFGEAAASVLRQVPGMTEELLRTAWETVRTARPKDKLEPAGEIGDLRESDVTPSYSGGAKAVRAMKQDDNLTGDGWLRLIEEGRIPGLSNTEVQASNLTRLLARNLDERLPREDVAQWLERWGKKHEPEFVDTGKRRVGEPRDDESIESEINQLGYDILMDEEGITGLRRRDTDEEIEPHLAPERLQQLVDEYRASAESYGRAQPRFEKYTSSGPRGEYTETVRKGTTHVYVSPHFTDVQGFEIPGYEGHFRRSARKTESGERAYHIEELQNDKVAFPRKLQKDTTEQFEGLPESQRPNIPKDLGIGDYYSVYTPLGGFKGAFKTRGEAEAFTKRFGGARVIEERGVPASVLDKDWSIDLFKQTLKEAVQNQDQRLTWTTGAEQFRRYPDGDKEVEAKRKAGMGAFYDRDLVNQINDYVKGWGAKVEQTKLDTGEVVHSIKITDAMRAGVVEGTPRFGKPTRRDQALDIEYAELKRKWKESKAKRTPGPRGQRGSTLTPEQFKLLVAMLKNRSVHLGGEFKRVVEQVLEDFPDLRRVPKKITEAWEQLRKENPLLHLSPAGKAEAIIGAANRRFLDRERAAMGLEELPPGERRGVKEDIAAAREARMNEEAEAGAIAWAILDKKLIPSSTQIAGLRERLASTRVRLTLISRRLNEVTHPAEIKVAAANRERAEAEWNLLSRALDAAGEEHGRALRSFRDEIGLDYSPVSLKARAVAKAEKPIGLEAERKLDDLGNQIEVLGETIEQKLAARMEARAKRLVHDSKKLGEEIKLAEKERSELLRDALELYKRRCEV